MILIISCIALIICIVLFFVSLNNDFKGKWEGIAIFVSVIGTIAVVFGLGLIGFLHPVEHKTILPEGAFLEKTNNIIVVVVPNIGNKIIDDPAIVNYLTKGDTIIVKRDYNSYGLQIQSDKVMIYVRKNGRLY